MATTSAVVYGIFAEQAAEMDFVEDGHLIESAPNASDPSLCDIVLPETSERGPGYGGPKSLDVLEILPTLTKERTGCGSRSTTDGN